MEVEQGAGAAPQGEGEGESYSFNAQEVRALMEYVDQYGPGKWDSISRKVFNGAEAGSAVRSTYLRLLAPAERDSVAARTQGALGIKAFTKEADNLLAELVFAKTSSIEDAGSEERRDGQQLSMEELTKMTAALNEALETTSGLAGTYTVGDVAKRIMGYLDFVYCIYRRPYIRWSEMETVAAEFACGNATCDARAGVSSSDRFHRILALAARGRSPVKAFATKFGLGDVEHFDA
ncbi:unnamed protein product [Pedinophyceae sp. YPF-701]|nr:unnamed protein product [Pedinophyceae sp. YPF-701]